jgi:hypothetical protein
MKFTIETKFNIGDVVYVAQLYHDFYATRNPYTIKSVCIKATPWHTYIKYDVERDGHIESISEACIFTTYEECEKWCKENN